MDRARDAHHRSKSGSDSVGLLDGDSSKGVSKSGGSSSKGVSKSGNSGTAPSPREPISNAQVAPEPRKGGAPPKQ